MGLVGRLEDLDIGDILRIISLSRKSGILSLGSQNQKDEARIVFRNGLIVSASSTAVKENVANALLTEGAVTLPVLKEAASHLRTIKFRRNLAWVLTERFGLEPEVIERAVYALIERIVLPLFSWREGFFSFELKETLEEIEKLSLNPLQPFLRKGIDPQELLKKAGGIGRSSSSLQGLSEIFARAYGGETKEVSPEGEEFLESIREEISKIAGENFSLPGASGEGMDEPVLASPGLRLLKSMVEELNDPNRYTDISLLVLRFASEVLNRAVLLMMREREIIGLGQFGVRLGGEVNPEKRVRDIRIPLEESSVFREVYDLRLPIRRKLRRGNPWEEYFMRMLGGDQPEESFLGPLISRNRVVAILYGDNLPERKRIGDTSGLEIFLAQAGIVMEKTFLERKLKEVQSIE